MTETNRIAYKAQLTKEVDLALYNLSIGLKCQVFGVKNLTSTRVSLSQIFTKFVTIKYV